MKIRPPILDARTDTEVFRSIVERAPGYTPEWLAHAGSTDTALARIFARYAAIFIEGLRETPARGFLAFLDRIGTRVLSAEAARAPLVFELMDHATSDPLLPANSEVAAAPQPKPVSALLFSAASAPASEEAVFTTDKMVTLARARIAALYSLDPGSDKFSDHTPQLTNGFNLFRDMRPTEHAVYLGHDQLFALAANVDVPAEIQLSVELAPGGAAKRPLEIGWEYLSEDGWLPLGLHNGDETILSDGTDGFTHDGQILLRKTCGPDAKEETFAGHKSYWIRGTLQGIRDGQRGLPPEGANQKGAVPLLETIRAKVSFVNAGLQPEAAANDGFALDFSTTFYPFGRQPTTLATFYLASKEVFERRGARVQIDFRFPANGAGAGNALVGWEYFNGKLWLPLTGFGLNDGTRSFKQQPPADQTAALTFICPPDWAETSVAGQTNYWLRARIDSGDYGKPIALDTSVNPPTATPATLRPPIIAAVTLQYSYQTDAETLDHCLSRNDFDYADHTHANFWPREFFEPFRPIAELQPAVHFGFDKPLPQGLVSLFVHAAQAVDEPGASEVPAFIWEYRAEHGWDELGVIDETAGFRRSGMIRFIGPKDAVAAPGVNGSLVRIRARLKIGERLAPATIAAVWMNAVWAQHRRRIPREELGISDGTAGQTFHFRSRTAAPVITPGAESNGAERPPFFREGTTVLEGERLEVREWVGRGADYETVIQGVATQDIRYERDRVSRAITEVWVRWQEQPHLLASRPSDRHYVIERSRGSVRFGDEEHGRIPPAGSRIVVTYDTGGGLVGNVPAGAIRELRSAVPFLKSVSNPIPALGGAATETDEAVQERGAQRLRHGDRAVSPSDIEWLAREASPAVARVRCLPVTGPVGHIQRGWITVAVLPHSGEAQPAPDAEVRREVFQHIAGRVPAPVAGRIRVVAPEYVPVGVMAEIVPRSAEEAARVEARALRRLNEFLHPLTGGREGAGWRFGEPLYLSQIAAVIEQTPDVDYVVEIGLRVGAQLFGELVSVGKDALIAAGDHELKLTLGER